MKSLIQFSLIAGLLFSLFSFADIRLPGDKPTPTPQPTPIPEPQPSPSELPKKPNYSCWCQCYSRYFATYLIGANHYGAGYHDTYGIRVDGQAQLEARSSQCRSYNGHACSGEYGNVTTPGVVTGCYLGKYGTRQRSSVQGRARIFHAD